MVATFFVFLREGIEASLIVSVLLTYLDGIGQRRHFRDVFAGVVVALVAVAGSGVAIYLVVKSYDGTRLQMIIETATFLLAVSVLTAMTFWMQAQGAGISAHLKRRAGEAIDGKARLGLSLLSFQAVGREGLETVVFTLAILFAASGPAPVRQAAAGGAAGLLAALALAYAIYRLGRRIDLGRLFRTVGALLMFFAAGLLADAVENLQALGWITLWNRPLWYTGRALSERSTLGGLLHSFFGYASRPTALQIGLYLVYLAAALVGFWLVSRKPARARAARGAAAAGGPAAAGPAPGGGEISRQASAPI